MAEVKKYDHDIFHKPGDEGSASQEQGKTYKGFDDPADAAPLGGSHDVVHRPGNEGSSELTPRKSDDSYIMGCNNAPSQEGLDKFLQGPEVRKTRVLPANGNPYDAMPGAR